jgi:hypothetical protein
VEEVRDCGQDAGECEMVETRERTVVASSPTTTPCEIVISLEEIASSAVR